MVVLTIGKEDLASLRGNNHHLLLIVYIRESSVILKLQYLEFKLFRGRRKKYKMKAFPF
jgi:hypothetical protein